MLVGRRVVVMWWWLISVLVWCSLRHVDWVVVSLVRDGMEIRWGRLNGKDGSGRWFGIDMGSQDDAYFEKRRSDRGWIFKFMSIERVLRQAKMKTS